MDEVVNKSNTQVSNKNGLWKILAIMLMLFTLYLVVIMVVNNHIHTEKYARANQLNIALYLAATEFESENEALWDLVAKYEIARNHASCQLGQMSEQIIELEREKRYTDLLAAARYEDTDLFSRVLVDIIADNAEHWDFDLHGGCTNRDGSLLMHFARKGPDIERLAFVAYDGEVIMDWDKLSAKQLDDILSTLLEKIEQDEEQEPFYWEPPQPPSERELQFI